MLAVEPGLPDLFPGKMRVFLKSTDNLKIAASHLPGKSPAVMFFPGFFSHMQGTKALWLEECCKKRGQSYIRFDYRGHGESEGTFEESTITDWLNDALLVLDKIAEPPVVAAGSSMGGWIALLAALARPKIIRGFVGIASSPDFTKSIYEERISDEERKLLHEIGYILRKSDYREEPVKITQKLIDDGQKHNILNRNEIDLNIPACLIHGKKDIDVPWQKSERLHQLIGKDNSELILVPNGEHRLSRPKELELIDAAVQKICSLIT